MTSRQRVVLFIVSSSIFFEALDIAIVNLAMPLIQKHFQLSSDSVQWTQTLYIIFYGGFLIIGGKLADLYGRKRIFIIGSAVFLVTSFAAGVTPTFEGLVLARAVQGLGAAFVIPSAFAIITNTFIDPHIRNQAIGIFGAFAAIGSGSGLSIGGLIATYFGWQWIFFINVPVIGLSIFLSCFYIPKDSTESRRERPDFLSGIILTTGIILLTFAIHEARYFAKFPLAGSLIILTFVVLVWTFIHRSKRINPLVQLSLFRTRENVFGFSAMILLGAFFSGYLFLISLVFQFQLEYSAAAAGFILLPFSILSAFVSRWVLPVIMQRISTWQGSILGMGLMMMGGILLLVALLADGNLGWIIASIGCVTGTGIAVCFMALNVLIIRRIPETDHGLASSIGTTSFFMGGGIGLTLLGLVMQLAPGYLFPAIVLTCYAAVAVVLLLIGMPRRRG